MTMRAIGSAIALWAAFDALTLLVCAANEPVFVDGPERPANKRIYYHYGFDIGGAPADGNAAADVAEPRVVAGDVVLQTGL